MAKQESRKKWRVRYIVKDSLAVSVLLGVVFVAVFYWLGQPLADELTSWVSVAGVRIFPTIATISGAMIGFIITSISIISGFLRDDRSRISDMRGTVTANEIFSVFFHTIISLGVTMVLALIGTAVGGALAPYFFVLFSFSVSISAASLARCLWILSKLTKGNSMEKVGPDHFDKSRS